MRTELRKFVIPEIVFGEGARELVGRYARNFGATRVLLVTDPGLLLVGWPQQAERSLRTADIPYVIFDGVTPNPKDYEVHQGAELYVREQCDVIVAVGGGSPMDCAKSIGFVTSNNRPLADFEGIDEVPVPGPPIICVPTTAGTSADISQLAIITDTKRRIKMSIVSKMIVADVALVDPVTTTTMDPQLTAFTGFDAVAHDIEAYVSPASSPLTDINALAAIPLILRYLPQAVRHPKAMEFRTPMMMASLMAGLAFSNAGLGAVHALSHALGGLLDLPHSECNMWFLNSVIDFNFSSAVARYRRLGESMGLDLSSATPDQSKTIILERLASLEREVGVERTWQDIHMSADMIPRLAATAATDVSLLTNPRTLTLEDIQAIYERTLLR